MKCIFVSELWASFLVLQNCCNQNFFKTNNIHLFSNFSITGHSKRINISLEYGFLLSLWNREFRTNLQMSIMLINMWHNFYISAGASTVVPRVIGILKDCNHAFHETCLTSGLFPHTKSNHVQCPVCKKIYGKKTGNQPKNARMSHYTDHRSLGGYENCGTIVIKYDCLSDIQGPEHPNPGMYVNII